MSAIRDESADVSHTADMIVDRIRKTDLNLLTILYVLIEERGVTKAAHRMLTSQPAMSRALARLQTAFEDKLLVRDGGGYIPTPRALAIKAQLEEILPRIGDLFGPSKIKFDPTRATGLFRIEAGDFAGNVLIPGLVCVLAHCAPELQVDILPRRLGFEALEGHEVDLVLTRVESSLASAKTTLRYEAILRERIVCLMRSDHPLAKQPLTLRRYVKAKHISLLPMAGMTRHHSLLAIPKHSIGRRVEGVEQTPDVRVRIPYFGGVGQIVANTDLVATLPLQIARRLADARTRIVDAPREYRSFSSFDQVWCARDDSNPVHRLVRGLVRSLAQSVMTDLSSLPKAGKGKMLGISKMTQRRIQRVIRDATL